MAKNYSIYLLLLFSSFFHQVSAQNYAPFSPARSYHYQFQPVAQSLARYNVRLLTPVIQGMDTVYPFNLAARTINIPDTTDCDMNMVASIYDWNQINYFGDSIRYHSNGDFTWVMENGDRLLIKPYESTGVSWNSGPSLTASIVSRSMQNVMGVMDSVISINFSNGASLGISENFGAVSFPEPRTLTATTPGINWNLVSIPEVNPGTPFGFSEIFDFDIGDKFGYQSGTLPFTGGSIIMDGRFINLEIIAKYESPNRDTFKYQALRSVLVINSSFWGGADTAYILPVDTQFINYYQPQYPILARPHGAVVIFPYMQTPLRLWDRQKTAWNNRWNVRYHSSVVGDTCHTILFNYYDSNAHSEYTEGLGLTLHSTTSIFDGVYELLCYEKGSEVRGTCIDFGTYVNTDPSYFPEISLEIGPNPASDFLNWRIKGSSPGETELRLMDLNGKEILREHSQGSMAFQSGKLNLDGIPPALYLLQIRDESGRSVTKKISIQRN